VRLPAAVRLELSTQEGRIVARRAAGGGALAGDRHVA